LGETRVETLADSKRLWFSTATANLGPGILEVRGGTPVVQRIYRSDGTFWDRPTGELEYEPEHGHIHFENWAVYRLRTVSSDGSPGPVVSQGTKTSFCLFDVQVLDYSNPYLQESRYWQCDPTVQGITPGWADVYDYTVPGQWLDITGLPDGHYWLEAEVDPNNQILELDETNNVSRIEIFLGPPPPLTPDAYEPNDTFDELASRVEGEANSPRLGVINQRVEIDDLSMGDEGEDFFSFRLEHPAKGGLVATESLYLEGDLDMILLNSAGALVDFSSTLGSYERISLAGLPEGEYSIEIFSYYGTNPQYSLVIDPGLNAPPEIQLTAPMSTVWVERAFENPAVKWTAFDPEGDPTLVSLSVARERTLDKSTITLLTYQHVDGATGAVNINTNTEALDLGEWFVHATITDGGGIGEAWAPGSFVIYVKGDLNFDGVVDRADLLLLKRARGPRGFKAGWNFILDMNRNGTLGVDDLLAFSRLVLANSAGPTCGPGR
jgi:hypothetical protein